jgi:hypothetical protein
MHHTEESKQYLQYNLYSIQRRDSGTVQYKLYVSNLGEQAVPAVQAVHYIV